VLVRVLLAVDPPLVRRRLARLVKAPGVEVAEISVRSRLWEQLTHQDADVVVLGSGSEEPSASLIEGVRGLPDRPEVVVVRAHEDAAERARLLASGCLAVLWLGLSDDMLAQTLRVVVTRRRDDGLRRLRADRPGERQSLSDFVYASPAMQRFVAMARRVVSSDSALLILGETGVGKERLARAIHSDSPRAEGPFLAVNCGALPESLLESELFGHEEGAFTGATRAHRGYFEMAHRGTIFLDEIGDLPAHVQVKLLRVLEDRQVRRVGGERSVRVDVRVMAATNRDLDAELKAKRFRSDLYFRLAVVTLTVPPLRDRREDIPPLVRHYLDHFRASLGRPVTGISAEAIAALVAYDWPGNVRELINVLERAVLLSHGTELDLADLPSSVTGRAAAGQADAPDRPVFDPAWLDRPLLDARASVLAEFERRYLARLLGSNGGRIAATAEKAGVNPRTLFDLLRRHRLDKRVYKRP